jgi:hypothetical protein
MTFEELKLCMAIHRARLGHKDRPRSRDRDYAVERVFSMWLEIFGESKFPWSVDDVVHWLITYRKRKENRIKVEIALSHGWTCYFKNRGKGPCCSVAEWGHIVPRSAGGPDTPENGQIECFSHNRQRGGRVPMTIEEYLASDLTTSSLECSEAAHGR